MLLALVAERPHFALVANNAIATANAISEALAVGIERVKRLCRAMALEGFGIHHFLGHAGLLLVTGR